MTAPEYLGRTALACMLLKPELVPVAEEMGLKPHHFRLSQERTAYQGMSLLSWIKGADWGLRELAMLLEFSGRLEEVGGLAYLGGLGVDLPDLAAAETTFAQMIQAFPI